MNFRVVIVLAGLLLIGGGVFTAVSQSIIFQESEKNKSLTEKIREGEELLLQSAKTSHEKALSIFSELNSKEGSERYRFQIQFGLGRALEKNSDQMRALEIYQELNQKLVTEKWTGEREKLSYSLGYLLLKLNREEEGKGHLEEVLKKSSDKKIRSLALSSLGDFFFRKKDLEKARKNYSLAVQEDGSNTHARIGWGRVLFGQGKDWASYEIFDDYISDAKYFDIDGDKKISEYSSAIFQRGKDQYNKREFWRAIETFQKLLSMKESSKIEERSLYYISESYASLGRGKDAIKYIDRMLNNSDTSLDQSALFRKGTIYFKWGSYEKAASVFQTIIHRYPKNHITDRAIAWKKECLELLTEDNYLRFSEIRDRGRDEKEIPSEDEVLRYDVPKPDYPKND
ncbi:MAG: tetratricopeptide repeat protein [Leptospiraceae bacterium]|nr:tetratricopeptide repeat protein [Leptospiraceae bacterium]MCK6382436.1 tetratricopeptide repeat protein [Leptospiraceae bacterium]NUM40841.1 tetratricopeptide repeat protein [Leptospiraceae bacterium]